MNYLKSEGYIAAPSRSSVVRCAGSRKPSFVAITEGLTHDAMLANLFDPLLHISPYVSRLLDLLSHIRADLFYKVVSHEASKTELGLSSQRSSPRKANHMLPPATPAVQTRKRKPSQTPASGLDLHESTTPYQTPRLRPQYDRQVKCARTIDNDVIAATPPSRNRPGRSANCLRSVRTAFMLDANGLSSSPGRCDLERH